MKSITSPSNPFIKHLHKLASKKSYRHECKEVLVESLTTIQALLDNGLTPSSLCSTDENLLQNIPCPLKYHVTHDILQKISPTKSPQKLIAIFPIPAPATKKPKQLLICNSIRDPGNLGTLFRSAQAFSFSTIWLVESCADPYNPKTVRSSKGATLLIPFQQLSIEECLTKAHDYQIQLYSAFMKAPNFRSIIPSQPFAIIVGNEAEGVDKQLQAKATAISIPMDPGCESLNAAIAGSILMQAMNQRKATDGDNHGL